MIKSIRYEIRAQLGVTFRIILLCEGFGQQKYVHIYMNPDGYISKKVNI